MPQLRVPDLIAKKRDGHELTDSEVAGFIEGVVRGHVTDAQTGAMLMAMFLNGLSSNETATLTEKMLHSGEVLSWPEDWRGTVVDKHSTGGVGEKSSLVLTPALAACGLKVPMITGRGLGHTGGTLDKLEAIPHLLTSFPAEDLAAQLDQVGAFIVGPTDNMVPADRILYATRDTTGTVANKSLIAASIMSKKAAENLDALVLQLTFGKAAFMKTEQDARSVGRILIDIGTSQGITTTGLLLQMNEPLGRMIGNSLEVAEAVHCLNGEGPADLHEVVCKLGGQLLKSTGHAQTVALGEARIDRAIKDGSAKRKFMDIATYQGADRHTVESLFKPDANLSAILPSAKDITHITSDESGYIEGIDAMACGTVAHQLGAGRTKPSDSINMAVGIELMAQVGDFVNKGDVWAKVHHDTPLTPYQLDMLQSALTISGNPLPAERLQKIVDVLH